MIIIRSGFQKRKTEHMVEAILTLWELRLMELLVYLEHTRELHQPEILLYYITIVQIMVGWEEVPQLPQIV